MYLSILLVTLVFLAGPSISIEPTCPRDSEKCTIQPFKYLLYDVSAQEGFNLRRDVYMRYAIMLTESQKRNEKLNWRLVLPPFDRLPHWRHEDYYSDPIEWRAFFDIDSMESYAPIVELNDTLFEKLPLLDIDRVYILQNYENAFENGHFVEKWDIVGNCNDLRPRRFWGYPTKTLETLCVKFQGQVSKIWELISLHPHDQSVMIYHAEIPLHSSYGTKTYWDCRKSMKFNGELIAAATAYIKTHFECDRPKCDTYISVHWRRGDFARSRQYDVPSIEGAAKQIAEMLTKHNLKKRKIFVATDADALEIDSLETALKEYGYYAYFYLPGLRELYKYKDGGIAIIEQIICSRAAYFLGTHESTFTFRIQEEREILGFNSNTTFNRLCPDTGTCEPPSVWKIVN